MTAPALDYDITLPRALARLAWTSAKWLGLILLVAGAVGLYLSLIILVICLTLLFYMASIVVAVVVFA